MRALKVRSAYFQNFVLAVISTGFVIGGCAVYKRDFLPLLGVLFLFPACMYYWFWDHQVLFRWQSSLLDDWAHRRLDFYAYRLSLRAVPGLPRPTIESMLSMLPVTADLRSEQATSACTRRAVTASAAAGGSIRSTAIVVGCYASAVAVVVVFISILERRWISLLGLALIFPPLVAYAWLRHQKAKAIRMLLIDYGIETEFNCLEYRNLVGSIKE